MLVDCALGKVDDVVELDQAVAEGHAKAGEVDVHPDAVTYAKQQRAARAAAAAQ